MVRIEEKGKKGLTVGLEITPRRDFFYKISKDMRGDSERAASLAAGNTGAALLTPPAERTLSQFSIAFTYRALEAARRGLRLSIQSGGGMEK